MGKFVHIYRSLQDQVKSEVVCGSCSGTISAAVLGPCSPQKDVQGPVDLLFTGSPCDPFSQQRVKRFSDGNVAAHEQFEVTMSQVIKLYLLHEPKKAVFEQVMGFTMPFVSGGSETPKDRPGLLKGQHQSDVLLTNRY